MRPSPGVSGATASSLSASGAGDALEGAALDVASGLGDALAGGALDGGGLDELAATLGGGDDEAVCASALPVESTRAATRIEVVRTK
jgi:hypothetical protein